MRVPTLVPGTLVALIGLGLSVAGYWYVPLDSPSVIIKSSSDPYVSAASSQIFADPGIDSSYLYENSPEVEVEPAPAFSCGTVGVVGDSTGVTLLAEGSGHVSTADGGTPLTDALKDVGVSDVFYNIVTGRSFGSGGSADGIAALDSINSQAHIDCYIVIMGTNDAVSIAGGSSLSAQRRAQMVMEHTGSSPVYWMSPVISTQAHINSQIADDFTNDLFQYAQSDPRLHVIDTKKGYESLAGTSPQYPSSVDGFFAGDGIHYPQGTVTQLRAGIISGGLESDS